MRASEKVQLVSRRLQACSDVYEKLNTSYVKFKRSVNLLHVRLPRYCKGLGDGFPVLSAFLPDQFSPSRTFERQSIF